MVETPSLCGVYKLCPRGVTAARDKAIADRENSEKDDEGKPTMNNKNIDKYPSDTEARFGCKGEDKIWIGYKRHVAVDGRLGFITKVAVTPANVSDQKALKHVCPKGGMVLADKAYCASEAQRTIKLNGCYSGAILKNNMKDKNHAKDKWLSSVRMPFENVFSKQSKLARFKGVIKNQFQAFMQAFTFNLKRLVSTASPPIQLVPV